jgi:hypothetical protein
MNIVETFTVENASRVVIQARIINCGEEAATVYHLLDMRFSEKWRKG